MVSEFGAAEAAFAIAGLKTDVTTWHFPNDFSDDHYLILNDCLTLNLLPHGRQAQIRAGNGQELSSPAPIGSLSFLPTGTHIVARAPGSGQSRNATCFFQGAWFRELSGLTNNLHPSSIQACLDLKNTKIEAAMHRLADELLSRRFASDILIEGLGIEIAVELARHLRQLESNSESTHQVLTAMQIDQVKAYLDEFLGFIPDMDELAAVCGISSRHFRRLFRKTMDKSPSEFARDAWATKVKTLLDETDTPLKQIMFKFGFVSSSSFTMAFRRATGQTPAAYRRYSRQKPALAASRNTAINNGQANWQTTRRTEQNISTIDWMKLSLAG